MGYKTNVLDSILHKSWDHAEFIGKSFKNIFVRTL